MNKKVIIIAGAVLAFFAGAILASEVPVVSTLVAFLEVCAGFVCGFFFNKELVNKKILTYEEENASLKSAQQALTKEKAKISKKSSAKK